MNLFNLEMLPPKPFFEKKGKKETVAGSELIQIIVSVTRLIEKNQI